MTGTPSPSPDTTRRDRWIAILFLVTLLLFPIQYWFAKSISEPYPALIMPAFEGSMITHAGVYQIQSADVMVTFQDGRPGQLTLRQLFFDAPASHVLPMARIAFYPRRTFDASSDDFHGSTSARRWIKGHLLPGMVVSQIHRNFRSDDDTRSRDWLKARLIELYPDRSPAQVEFLWHPRAIIPNDVERSIPLTPNHHHRVTF